MAKRETVMLCSPKTLGELQGMNLGNWFVSEKLDGMRCLWLPDTRGFRLTDLPWANLKGERLSGRVSSGLWSRYLKPIFAPDSWVETLPKNMTLDGELYLGRNSFQELIGIVKRTENMVSWDKVRFVIFDSPPIKEIYKDGVVKNPLIDKSFKGYYDWCKGYLGFDYSGLINFDCEFEKTNKTIDLSNCSVAYWNPQIQLTWRNVDAINDVQNYLSQVIDGGGEGIVLRAPHSKYECVRSKLLIKVKAVKDGECKVLGFNDGVGKLEGLVGSVIVEDLVTKKQFALSGFTDLERVHGVIKINDILTYTYRELTDDGLPKEARYLRKFV